MKSALDPYFGLATGGRSLTAVTPSDTNDLAVVTTLLIVTIGTGIAVIPANAVADTPVTIPLAVGTYKLPIQIRRVMATGTVLGTNGGVTALWS